MRKIIVFNMVTADGFIAGSNGEIDWHNVDEAFNEYAIETFKTIETILFGRVTYEIMESYWPTESGKEDNPIVANIMNTTEKIVFSKTLKNAEWNNTAVHKYITNIEINALKQKDGGDIIVLGSGTIVQELTKFKLVDEYRFMINPVVLGAGKTMFNDRLNLKFLKTKEFKNGNILLCYSPQ